MSRRFLSALQRRDLSGIRRALFLEPLLMRNAGAQPAQGPEETGGDPDDEKEDQAPGGPGVDAAPPVPSDTMMLPKPPPMP
jgi:hypothetical protein